MNNPTPAATVVVEGLVRRYGRTTALNGVSLTDRKSTRLNSSHLKLSRMPSSA